MGAVNLNNYCEAYPPHEIKFVSCNYVIYVLIYLKENGRSAMCNGR